MTICHYWDILHVDSDSTFRYFLEEAALWLHGKAKATDVVDAAVQALLDGVDSPSFVLVAGLGAREAEANLTDLLDAALEELGFNCLRFGDPDNDILTAAAMCRGYLKSHCEAQELTREIHKTFGHNCHAFIETLSNIDDSFDTLEYSPHTTHAKLERQTHMAATDLRDESNRIYRQAQSSRS